MHAPAGESQAHRMDAAAQVIRQGSLVGRVEQVAVGDADRDRRNQEPHEETEMAARVAEDGGARARRRGTSPPPGRGSGARLRLRCLELRQRLLPSQDCDFRSNMLCCYDSNQRDRELPSAMPRIPSTILRIPSTIPSADSLSAAAGFARRPNDSRWLSM